jgi:hypothetical protein
MASAPASPPKPDGIHPSAIGNTAVPLRYDAALVNPASIPNRCGMAPAQRTKVELFYDVVSPYSWLG